MKKCLKYEIFTTYLNGCFLEGYNMMSKIQPPCSKTFILQTFFQLFSRGIFSFHFGFFQFLMLYIHAGVCSFLGSFLIKTKGVMDMVSTIITIQQFLPIKKLYFVPNILFIFFTFIFSPLCIIQH